jgi:hypothetical protein
LKGKNPDHATLWKMLVYRDIRAFVESDWTQIEDDFLLDRFYGTNAHFSPHPESWTLDFPLLSDYQTRWLAKSQESKEKNYVEPLEIGLHKLTQLKKIETNANKAAVWKQFNGTLKRIDGPDEVLRWQTIYFCEFIKNEWKILGFIGYLPM